MSRLSLEERFRKKLTKVGKKNRFCRYLVIPVLAGGLFFFHGAAYLRGNVKRLAMVAMTALLFVVYSSFSFPIFSPDPGQGEGLSGISEEAEDIVLAKEVEIDLDDISLPEGEGFPEDGEYLETHGDIVELYSASEILEAAEDWEARNGDGAEGGEAAPEPEDVGDMDFSREDWRLVLVNKQHSIPDDYVVMLGTIRTLKGKQYIDERIIDDLLAMLRAAEDEDVELQICSPYRTQEYQKKLFNNHMKAYMKKGLSYMEAFQLSSVAVNVPGYSEHQIGLALDIVTPTHQSLTESFADTDAGVWLAENCYKYGFILRYPKGKEYITGIEFEPWHFRYVGVEAATVMTEQGMTLEEFWEELE